MKIKKRGAFRLLPLFSSLLLILLISGGCGKLPAEHKVVTPRDGEIRLSLGEVNDGKVHFYTYKKSGKRINFFVRADGNDNLSACFDACFTCYKHKKGYRQEGTDIVCNECNMMFRLADEHWDNSKGCSPISVKSRVEKNELVIMTGDLERGLKLF